MQRILTLLAFFQLSLIASAQHHAIAVRAGATYNGSSTDLSGRLYESTERHWGLYLNLVYRYNLTKNLALESGLSFIERNYGSRRTDIYSGVYSKTKNAFVELPLKAVFHVYKLNDLNFKIAGGLFGAYWLSSKASGALPNLLDAQTGNTSAQGEQLLGLTQYSGKNSFHQIDNRFQFGGIAGLEIGWIFKPSLQAVLCCDMYHTLSPHEKKTSPSHKGQREKDNGVLISTGIIWSLSRFNN